MKYAVWTSGVLVLAGAVLAVSGCAKSEVGAGTGQSAPRPAVPVEVAIAVRADVPVQIRAIARVEAYATVTVKPQVAGQLMAAHFQEGQDVKAGDLLFSLDPRPFQAALAQAEGNLARDAALAKDAAAQAAREADLYQQNVATQREYESSQADAAAKAATVQADQATVEVARLNLEYCSIRSPVDGRTGAVLAYPGNVVKANEAQLVTVNQVSPIYVTFSVPEPHLAQIRKYQAAGPLPVEADFPQDEGPPERGALSFIDNQVDRMSGMILLKGTFQNEHRRLWPGQFVNAVLTLRTLADATVVPTPAIQIGQAGQFVFVVKADQTVESRPVVTGLALDDRTVIERGIEPGETIVTDGQLRLVPDARISVKQRGAATTQESGT
jgi:membrane fusion protein, multidrug efflux system